MSVQVNSGVGGRKWRVVEDVTLVLCKRALFSPLRTEDGGIREGCTRCSSSEKEDKGTLVFHCVCYTLWVFIYLYAFGEVTDRLWQVVNASGD